MASVSETKKELIKHCSYAAWPARFERLLWQLRDPSDALRHPRLLLSPELSIEHDNNLLCLSSLLLWLTLQFDFVSLLIMDDFCLLMQGVHEHDVH